MKTAILGGTFNPVHTGHLFLADEVIAQTDYEQVMFIPTFMPAHKKIFDPIEPFHRLEMLKIATDQYSCFSVDDCELQRGGASFMIDTLHEILKKHSFKEKIGLIIGDDLADSFSSWKNPEEILKLAELLIVRRLHERTNKYTFPCRYIFNKILPVSSTEIRERIKGNLPVRFLLPKGVCTYIEAKKLYRPM